MKDTLHDHLLKHILIVIPIIGLLVISRQGIGASLSEVVDNRHQAQIFLSQFFQPEWAYFPKIVQPMIITLAMSVAGTFLGTLFAIPAAFLATYIVTQNWLVTVIFRAFFSLIRTIPIILLAAIFVAIIGIGEFTGLLTVAVFTFGILSQLIFNAIENIDLGPIEANESIGATKFQIALMSIWPQISKAVYRHVLYCFEINVRGSAILGYVGAGGIGMVLNTALGFRQYGRVSLIVLSILIVVILVDAYSERLRERV